jgi:folate-binding protein YgfZ
MAADNWQTSNVFCDLSHLGLLQLSGEDARSFLQGQVSNDVNALNDSTAHLSAYCSPKGRMLALFLAFAQGDDLFLQLDSGIIEAIAKRLRMYVMRSKVEIADVSNDWARIGVSGPDAAALLGKHYTELPKGIYAATSIDGGILIQLPSIEDQQRYEIFIAADKATALTNQLANDFTKADQDQWNWLDIQAGLPEIFAETQQQFVPQMVNLDLLGGINFKKGCYTGQEIVARTHYLGTVKRRTYLANINSKTTPKAGDKVVDNTQNEVGQIVRVAPSPTSGYDALIEMRIEAQASGHVQWQDAVVRFKDLPYSLEATEA